MRIFSLKGFVFCENRVFVWCVLVFIIWVYYFILFLVDDVYKVYILWFRCLILKGYRIFLLLFELVCVKLFIEFNELFVFVCFSFGWVVLLVVILFSWLLGICVVIFCFNGVIIFFCFMIGFLFMFFKKRRGIGMGYEGVS